MVRVSRILCPVDFSEPSRQAFEYALLLARQFGAALTVLHVMEATPLLQAYNGVPDLGLLGQAERSAREEMARLLAAHDTADVRLKSDLVQGPTYRTIAAYAAADSTDLLVIGSHGRGLLEHAFFGSVTERVMKSVHCPVLVVRAPKRPADAGQEMG